MDDEAQKTAVSKIAELPPSLVIDILSKLPIKTLLNCRCVCKTWLQLISDPFFVKLQLARSSTCVLLRHVEESRRLLFCDLVEEAIGDGCQVGTMEFVAGTNLPNSGFDFVNSCNGLLCLVDTSDFEYVYVCNPILGEYITIPVPNAETRHCKLFAFGFSSISNQYKILHTFHSKENGNERTHYPEANIYTLGTGQWRSIGSAPYNLVSFLDFNTFLHGSIHWVHHFSEFRYICSFDFENEQFKSLPAPPHCDGKFYETVKLGILNCSLCASFSHYRYPEEFDIWLMKEYGVKESWTRFFVIENLFSSAYNFEYYEILFLLNNDEILMLHYRGGCVCYNATRKTFQDIRIIRAGELSFPTAYNPCFVSLQDFAIREQVTVSSRN